MLDLPPEETLVPIANSYFQKYGAITVFVAALIEGILVVGWYFPGSTIIVLCLIIASSNEFTFGAATLSAAAGLSLAYMANYGLGKYGWYNLLVRFGFRDTVTAAKKRVSKHGLTAIFLTYWQFGLASATSTAAGILHIAFLPFVVVSTLGVLFWTAFYAGLIFFLGPAAMQLVGLKLLLLIAAVWILVVVARELAMRRRRAS